MNEKNMGETTQKSAMKAGMSLPTARKYLKLGGNLPEKIERNWRTRPDPFKIDWSETEEFLSLNPGLDANTLFDYLQLKFPGKYQDGQLRTFQRRVKEWRIANGGSKEVFFTQIHHPGKLCESDFTNMNTLCITIGNQTFDHLVYHFILTYSNWETGNVCFSESFESLSEGFQKALHCLGGVPQEHQTDCLSAAVKNLTAPKSFTERYQALLNYYNIKLRRTNPSSPNENGDIEQRHYRFKRALDQSLMIRGNRNFETQAEYKKYLKNLFIQLNTGRRDKLDEELNLIKALPNLPMDARRRINVRVGKGSTIRVLQNTYSVDSALINQKIDVWISSDELEIKLSGRLIERLPRIKGKNKHKIDYRHIIKSLVRKPGAFNDYKYRDELFPSSHFRLAYDSIKKQRPERADKEYLKLLEISAMESETEVEAILIDLRLKKITPSIETVEHMLNTKSEISTTPTAHVHSVDLDLYDSLLENVEVN